MTAVREGASHSERQLSIGVAELFQSLARDQALIVSE
jgi:hypothetical protein